MLWCNYRMRLTFVLLALNVVCLNAEQPQTNKKKESNEKSTLLENKSLKGLPKNAIIAIEVVDSNDNSTKEGKGRKRTIESALGYGYNGGYENFFNVKVKPPKYEVYKYSQHDIPAYNRPSKVTAEKTFSNSYQQYNHASHSDNRNQNPRPTSYTHVAHGNVHESPQFEIQKSVQYDIGSTAPVYEPPTEKKPSNLQQYYQHGTTLFSSVDNNGHLTSLSSQVPSNHGPMVPVIILRVYTNQLGQNSLHANIPEGHPYANLNSVDLQSLLAGYVQNNPNQHSAPQYYQPTAQDSHQPVQEQTNYQVPVQPATQYTENHANLHQNQNVVHNNHVTGLLTNENYPDDAHTKVIFKKPVTNTKSRNKQRGRPAQKFKITIPENTYSKVEVQEHTYGGPHDGGQYVQQHVHYAQPQEASTQEQYEQQYYYQQPDQYNQHQHPQHNSQQEYQSSIHSVVQYQQVQPNNDKDSYTVQYKHPQAQAQTQQVDYNHQEHQQQQQQQPNIGYQHQQYDPRQFVQVATYPNQAETAHNPQQETQNQKEYYQQYLQYVQQQQSQPQHQPLPSQNEPSNQYYQKESGAEIQYLQRSPEQGTENQDYALVKHSNDAGRDLHPKLYNYHAHDSPTQQSAPKKKRERKQRRSRVPLVLSPEVMSTLEKKQ